MFILFPQQQIYDISINVNSLTDVFLISYDINKATASDICSIYLSIFWKAAHPRSAEGAGGRMSPLRCWKMTSWPLLRGG